ncbi:MAG: hypothetical protein GY769_10360 [bacterium]|nr:hypothetical protein [bacterium]
MTGRSQRGRTVSGRLRFGVGALAVFWQVASGPALAFETDQYLALEAELVDSAEPVNAYLNAELEAFLARPAADRLSCRQIPPRFYRHLFQGLLASRLQKFLKSNPAVDLYPKGVGYREHLRRSVYRKPAFPYVLPLSPTIRIGEVRFGLDKFGHLFGFGRRYYKQYSRLRARGRSEEEAIRAVVRRGLHQERLFVGGWADGVFSYGDLEANYQGMELARRFCRGESPLLERSDRQWHRRRMIDLREYVTPSFDESYNNNHYPAPRWKKVRPILVAEYCDRFFSPIVQARMRRYEAIDRPNPSKRIIAEYFARKGRSPQQRQSMDAICNRPTDSILATTAFR